DLRQVQPPAAPGQPGVSLRVVLYGQRVFAEAAVDMVSPHRARLEQVLIDVDDHRDESSQRRSPPGNPPSPDPGGDPRESLDLTSRSMLAPSRPGSGRGAAGSTEARKNMGSETILVVEDHADIQLTVRLTLEMSGYKVMAASDSQQAFEALAKCTPDLILLDVSLPGVSGWQLLEKIRSIR